MAIMRAKLTLLEKKNHRQFNVDHYGTLVSLSVHTLHAKNSLTLLLIVVGQWPFSSSELLLQRKKKLIADVYR